MSPSRFRRIARGAMAKEQDRFESGFLGGDDGILSVA
jgi:hypothetical protein